MARIEFPSQKVEPVVEPELSSRGEQPGAEFTPILLTQLRDDLARSRLREAFWISLVAHLLGIILLALSPKLLPNFWHPVELRTAEEMIHDKEFTYLELPKDAQRPSAKAPDTKFLSDKNRIARSKVPTLDRESLESLRKGLPSPPGATVPQSTPSSGAPATAQSSGAANQQQSSNNSPLSAPATKPATPQNFSAFAGLSAGSAIEQAAKNSARRGFSTGGGGDYGYPNGGGSKVGSGLDVLSDTMGVDFGPYLSRIVAVVRMNWYNLIPEEARPPMLKKGKVAIEFSILPDGKVVGMRLIGESGDIALDRAAWGGITSSNPFSPLPSGFQGPYLALRFYFYYNPARGEVR
jgi:outer membrane biosynthesis protein TonB